MNEHRDIRASGSLSHTDPARTSSSTTHPSGERAKDKARELAGQAREEIGRATRKLRDRAREAAETRRTSTAEMTSDLSAAVRRAASELEDRGESRTAEWADMLAEQLDRAGDYLKRKDLDALWRDLEQLARRRPGLVVGGLFVAGIAASRFLKASRQHDDGELGRSYRGGGEHLESWTSEPASASAVPPGRTTASVPGSAGSPLHRSTEVRP